MEKSLVNIIAKSYYDQGMETEHMLYAIMLSTLVKIDLKSLNLFDAIKQIHKADIVTINFKEMELVFDNLEVHSVSGCKNDEGQPEVCFNFYDTENETAHSVRLHQFPNIQIILDIISAVDSKCEINFTDHEEL